MAVFAPLIIRDDDTLRAQAPALWRTVQGAAVSAEVRDRLSQVLEFWFFERFRGLTAKEIWAMLNLITPIEETRAYQSIFAEGMAKGEDKGKTEGKIEGEAEGRVFNLALFPHFSVPRPCDESEPLVASQDVDLKFKDSIAVPNRNCVSGTRARPIRLNTLGRGQGQHAEAPTGPPLRVCAGLGGTAD